MSDKNDNVVNFPGMMGSPPSPEPERDEEGLVPKEKRERLLSVLDFYVNRAKEGRISCLFICAQGPLDNEAKDPNATRYSVITTAGENSHPILGCIENAKMDMIYFLDETVDDENDDE